MATHTVTHADRSQRGTPRVYFDNKHHWQDAYCLKDCDQPPLGSVIEVKTHSWRPPDGKNEIWFLDDWRLAEKQPEPAAIAATQKASAKEALTREQTVQDDMVLRFVSNLVGHAIECGKVDSPARIQEWAGAALSAAQTVLARGEEERIPF